MYQKKFTNHDSDNIKAITEQSYPNSTHHEVDIYIHVHCMWMLTEILAL